MIKLNSILASTTLILFTLLTLSKYAQAKSTSNQCQAASNALISDIDRTSGKLLLKRINIHSETKIWSNPPKGEMFNLDIGGNQKTQWFNDADKMQSITSKLVKSCPGIIGAVVSIEGDYLSAYGLVNGRVKKFICPNSNSAPFPWGYYSGGCN
jgi:hypothetical protein